MVLLANAPIVGGDASFTSTNNLCISNQAMAFPGQIYLPYPNMRSVVFSIIVLSVGKAWRNRSGRKTETSSPNISVRRPIDQKSVPIFVPPGIKVPSRVSPFGGTTFGKSKETGGLKRRHSCRKARR